MSNTFYNFLAEQVTYFFTHNEIKAGNRFHIQFEHLSDVAMLVNSLKEISQTQDIYNNFNWEEEEAYKSFTLKSAEAEVLIANTSNDVTGDYTATLRNMVGKGDNLFTDKAILIIHHTILDTIINGTVSMQSFGMPLSYNSLKEKIYDKLRSADVLKETKTVINFILNQMDETDRGQSIFEYESIVNTLNEEITKEDYISLGLFHDPSLMSHDEETQFERLKTNSELFRFVQESESFGDFNNDLEKKFDEKGVNTLLTSVDWRELEYSFIYNSNKEKEKSMPPNYIENVTKETEEGLLYWERPEGETKAKNRKRHIIIFNPTQTSEVNLELKFDQSLNKSELNNSVGNAAYISRRKIIMQHQFIFDELNFLRFRYKEQGATFDFKVLIVPFSEEYFQNIKTNYLISFNGKQGSIEISSSNKDVSFCYQDIEIEEDKEVDLSTGIEQLNLTKNDKLTFTNQDEYIQNQGGEVYFDIVLDDIAIPLKFVAELAPLKYIDGLKIFKLKREKRESFQFDGENRAIQGNQEFIINDSSFINSLRLESYLIKENSIFIEQTNQGFSMDNIAISSELKQAYYEYLEYFQSKNLLPSLAIWDDTRVTLAKKYIECFINVINELEEGTTLTAEERNLTLLGAAIDTRDITVLKYSPLHPINVIYQLHLLDELEEDDEVPIEIIKRLDSKYLTPYIFHENKLFRPIEQYHSPEWTQFQDFKNARYHNTNSFVSRLVSDKIKEFTLHYKYIFEFNPNSPIKINLINLGDAREVLQGIFMYYIKQINNKVNLDQLLPIEVTIYQEGSQYTAFEDISFYTDTDEVERQFNVNLRTKEISKLDVLNVFRQKVRFYKKNVNEIKLNYAHITFYELDQNVDETTDNMHRLDTGVTLKGLFSSLNSTFIGESYRTGFGTKYVESNDLISFVESFNSLMLATGRQNTFERSKTIVTAFSTQGLEKLQKIYDASHWVTFIEPKVDLSFFTEKPENNNLLVLHYSDQYSPSTHYDAVTVTEKTKQFQVIIEEFLKRHVNNIDKGTTKNVINLFNSLNGDWLLRLIGQQSHFPREKMSILSAVKFGLAFFAHKNVIWIPLSLEEILRVSGAVGLDQKEGLFSAKNLGISGPTSDDILFVGIEPTDDKPNVYFYPVEVKIGNNTKDRIDKAKQQIKTTSETIYTQLLDNSFKSKTYRDFLMHLTVISAKKLKLYKIWPGNEWDVILNDSVRSKLLNDNYNIVQTHQEFLGIGSVISFDKGNIFRSVKEDDDYIHVSLTEKDGYNFLAANQKALFEQIHQQIDDFPKDKLFWNIYKTETSRDDEEVDSSHIEQVNNSQEFERHNQSSDIQIVAETKRELKTSNETKEPLKILFGHSNSTGETLNWYPTTTSKTMHTNTGIIGTMGTGKTQFTKSLIKQLHDQSINNVNGTPIGILIFDYKGDYIKEDFVSSTNATVYQPYHLPFNPLSLYEGATFKPLLPVHSASTIKETISTAFGLGIKQQQLISDIILDAYGKRGIDRGKRETWDRTPPTFKEVCNIFFSREDVKEDSLYAAMKQIDDFQIFSDDADNTKPLYDLINGITVINLTGYDRSVQNLVVGITLDSFYSQMATKGHSVIQGDFRELTKMILVDEADNFISQEFKSLKNIMKEGREYGVGTILSTQFLSHFVANDNDYADYILTWIVHRVPSIKKKEVQQVFNPETANEADQLMNKIAELQKHKSLVTNVSNNKYELMEDMAFWKLLLEE